MSHLYRQLPKVDRVLEDPLVAGIPRPVVVHLTRVVLDELRGAIDQGGIDTVPEVAPLVAARAHALLGGRMRPVINATGVVVHTNLGRAPWSDQAVEAAVAAARYCNLEMELSTGLRGGRLDGIAALVGYLTGAEAAVVVNNCAAAVLLALTALARDREVIVSRGELVEIGGSFRVPDVISSGGARLVEVGTTNRTRIADYERAITSDTAVLLRVHTSNFRVVGFTEAAPREELVTLARRRGLVVVEDLGSGSLDGEFGEPSVRDAVQAGVDLALFSGDKLLGGPQSGLAVGRSAVVARLRKHPLYRALRVDKVVLAALEATLAAHAQGRALPVDAMLRQTEAELTGRAEALRVALVAREVPARVEASLGYVGGGSLPGQALPSQAVVVDHPDPLELARRLRVSRPSICGRVADGALWLDARTLRDDEVDVVADGVASARRDG